MPRGSRTRDEGRHDRDQDREAQDGQLDAVGGAEADRAGRHQVGQDGGAEQGCEQRAERETGDGERRALDELTRHDACARRAERGSQGGRSSAGQGACEREVRNVQAGEKQAEPRGHAEDEERLAHSSLEAGLAAAAGAELERGREVALHLPLGDAGPAFPLDVGADVAVEPRLELHPGAGRVEAGGQAGEDVERALATIVGCGPRHDLGHHRERHEDVGGVAPIGTAKPGRGDPDDRHRVVVDADPGPEHRRVGAEATSPIVVRESDLRMGALRLVVALVEETADLRPKAKRGEVGAADELRLDELRLVVREEERLRLRAREEVDEHVLVGAQIAKERVRQEAARTDAASDEVTVPVELYDAFGLVDRELAHEGLVREREDRGARSDSERQRDDDDERRHRRAAHLSEREADVTRQVLEPHEAGGLVEALLARGDVPEAATGAGEGLGRLDALFDQLIRLEANVGLDLVAEVRVAAPCLAGTHLAGRSVGVQHPAHRLDQAAPVACLSGELLATARGELVEARAAVVVADAPGGFDVSLGLEPLERGVERAVIDEQDLVRGRLDGPRDALTVLPAEQQRAKDQDVEGALEEGDAVRLVPLGRHST